MRETPTLHLHGILVEQLLLAESQLAAGAVVRLAAGGAAVGLDDGEILPSLLCWTVFLFYHAITVGAFVWR